ncbi:hypothetical protein ACRXCV_06775 [Halobacteriovorax sp. GFR7]|uniref:hypothetical protein n=1 Tax=unclassified Halobacteriovorax TaxID=2639665 RepID=UPI003D9537D6
MKTLIKSILVLFVALNSFAYQQIFATSGDLKIRTKYHGDQDIRSIRIFGDTVSAYSKDTNGRDYNDVLFKITKEYAQYKEFLFDILEKGDFVILPNKTGKIEDLEIIYNGKKYSFIEAALFLNRKDLCGLGMECPTSNAAINDGRRTTAPGTQGPLRRADARKVDYMTRVNIF